MESNPNSSTTLIEEFPHYIMRARQDPDLRPSGYKPDEVKQAVPVRILRESGWQLRIDSTWGQ
jgi:hypothetical protein